MTFLSLIFLLVRWDDGSPVRPCVTAGDQRGSVGSGENPRAVQHRATTAAWAVPVETNGSWCCDSLYLPSSPVISADSSSHSQAAWKSNYPTLEDDFREPFLTSILFNLYPSPPVSASLHWGPSPLGPALDQRVFLLCDLTLFSPISLTCSVQGSRQPLPAAHSLERQLHGGTRSLECILSK